MEGGGFGFGAGDEFVFEEGAVGVELGVDDFLPGFGDDEDVELMPGWGPFVEESAYQDYILNYVDQPEVSFPYFLLWKLQPKIPL